MGLKAGWLALFVFVWIIGAILGSTFDFQSSSAETGQTYTTGTATFTTGSTTVLGIATVWNALMEDGVIKADADDQWIKIETVVNNTELTLYSPYVDAGGIGVDYSMQPTPGFATSGGGGYDVSPANKLEYLLNVTNAFQRLSLLGNVPLPVPNGEYFKTAFQVVTWQWSFFYGADGTMSMGMFYWIFCAPFIVMGVLSMILLVYGIFTGNITWG